MKIEQLNQVEQSEEFKNNVSALFKHLPKASKSICEDCECTEDEHFCESLAYVKFNGALLDICASDYFQGCSVPHAAISLPFNGTAKELGEEILNQCADFCED